MEGRSKVVGKDTQVKEEGEVSDVHPEGHVGFFPVDMLVVRQRVCRYYRSIRVHVGRLEGWSVGGKWNVMLGGKKKNINLGRETF